MRMFSHFACVIFQVVQKTKALFPVSTRLLFLSNADYLLFFLIKMAAYCCRSIPVSLILGVHFGSYVFSVRSAIFCTITVTEVF